MANSKPFFDLKSGRCSSVVDAMLLRYWEARNVKGGGELMWVDMLMVDIKLSDLSGETSARRYDIERMCCSWREDPFSWHLA